MPELSKGNFHFRFTKRFRQNFYFISRRHDVSSMFFDLCSQSCACNAFATGVVHSVLNVNKNSATIFESLHTKGEWEPSRCNTMFFFDSVYPRMLEVYIQPLLPNFCTFKRFLYENPLNQKSQGTERILAPVQSVSWHPLWPLIII